MYGVGQNPIYQARMEERQAKREASGEAARVREEELKALKVSALFEEQPLVQGEDDAGSSIQVDSISDVATEQSDQDIMVALFADAYGGFEDMIEDDVT